MSPIGETNSGTPGILTLVIGVGVKVGTAVAVGKAVGIDVGTIVAVGMAVDVAVGMVVIIAVGVTVTMVVGAVVGCCGTCAALEDS